MTKKLRFFFRQTTHAFDVTCPFSVAERSHDNTYRSLSEKAFKTTHLKQAPIPFLSWKKKNIVGALVAGEWERTCSPSPCTPLEDGSVRHADRWAWSRFPTLSRGVPCLPPHEFAFLMLGLPTGFQLLRQSSASLLPSHRELKHPWAVLAGQVTASQWQRVAQGIPSKGRG